MVNGQARDSQGVVVDEMPFQHWFMMFVRPDGQELCSIFFDRTHCP